MALINIEKKEIHCKLVYYGSAMSGKTNTLCYIHAQIPLEDRGDLLSIATETERALFFDCLAPEIPLLRGFRLRWHLGAYRIGRFRLYLNRLRRAMQTKPTV
jgi:hypothetical protein